MLALGGVGSAGELTDGVPMESGVTLDVDSAMDRLGLEENTDCVDRVDGVD